jgi:hypothetical protein
LSPNTPDIHRLNFNLSERNAVVEFLKSLSDERVRYERAPFDHPELCVPVGHADSKTADADYPSSAADRRAAIPAVGKKGNTVPLQTFAELLEDVGKDGSRAHTLTEPCRAN